MLAATLVRLHPVLNLDPAPVYLTLDTTIAAFEADLRDLETSAAPFHRCRRQPDVARIAARPRRLLRPATEGEGPDPE